MGEVCPLSCELTLEVGHVLDAQSRPRSRICAATTSCRVLRWCVTRSKLSVRPMHNPHPLPRDLKRSMSPRRPSTRLQMPAHRHDVRATGAEVHVESTQERTLDDLVDAQVEFLSSRRAEEQIDDVPSVPKTKREDGDSKAAQPTSPKTMLSWIAPLVDRMQSDTCYCCIRSTTSSSSNRKFPSSVSPHHLVDHAIEAQCVFNDMKTLKRHRRL